MSMKQRASISAESYGLFNQQSKTFIVIEKNEEEKKLIRDKMLKSFLFKEVDDRNYEIIINAFEEYNFKKGENIITQGESGSVVFLLDTGEADCFITIVYITIVLELL